MKLTSISTMLHQLKVLLHQKKETVLLANAVRKAQAEYSCAIIALVDALLARAAIKAKSPVVTKLAKASALEKDALDAIRELGY